MLMLQKAIETMPPNLKLVWNSTNTGPSVQRNMCTAIEEIEMSDAIDTAGESVRIYSYVVLFRNRPLVFGFGRVKRGAVNHIPERSYARMKLRS